jgi:HEAT repeat protein
MKTTSNRFWASAVLLLLVSSGCSNSKSYSVVSKPKSEAGTVTVTENSQSVAKNPSKSDSGAQQEIVRAHHLQGETASQTQVRQAGHKQPQARRAASGNQNDSSKVQKTRTLQPKYNAPPISPLHRERQERNAAALVTKLETPALIFTTMPPKAEGEVAELLEIIRSGDTQDCREAIYMLGKHGPEAVAAAPALTVMLKDHDHLVRVHSALALWRITKRAEFSVPLLADSVNFGSSTVRSLAAVALGEMGPAAQKAIPALTAAVKMNPGKIRVQAAEALWYVAGHNQLSLETIVTALRGDDPEIRWAAAYALGGIAPQDRTVIAALSERLRDSNDAVRVAAAFALGEIGPSAKPAVAMLITAVRDPNEDVRQAAAVALKQVEMPSRVR